jgi:hypothetical protein
MTPPSITPDDPLEPTLAAGDPRPQVRASMEVDAASIPVGTWGPPQAGVSFRVTTDPNEFHVTGTRFAEVRVGSFSAFTDTTVPLANWPQCHHPGSATALVRGLSVDGWSEDSIELVMTRGPFDYASCTARAEASIVKRALGIVPGFVYALRVEDSVYVVLPHAWFASATRNAAGSGSFSSATLPCKPHHEAAAAMRIAAASLSGWQEISTLGVWAHPEWTDSSNDVGLLVIVEVRARGDGNVVAVSLALPQTSGEDTYAPFFDALRKVLRKEAPGATRDK